MLGGAENIKNFFVARRVLIFSVSIFWCCRFGCVCSLLRITFSESR